MLGGILLALVDEVGLYLDPPAHAIAVCMDERSQIVASARVRLLGRRSMGGDCQQPTETDTLLLQHVAVGKPGTHHDRQLPKDGSAVRSSQPGTPPRTAAVRWPA